MHTEGIPLALWHQVVSKTSTTTRKTGGKLINESQQ